MTHQDPSRDPRKRLSPWRPLAYTNRNGQTYFLHEGRTKTGKPRYFVSKTVGDGARPSMPDGFEFCESIHGVVSVRRVPKAEDRIPDADLEAVRAELARHKHLHSYVADITGGAIVIHEPIPGLSLGASSSPLEQAARELGISLEALQRASAARPSRYTPVMKLERDPADRQCYVLSRMTYRGYGGWRTLGAGRLRDLARRYVRHLGTDGFFELY